MTTGMELAAFSAADNEHRQVEAFATAKAVVESRYLMAINNRRDWRVVRQAIEEECQREGFALNPSAVYFKPIGKGITGLGIRFVEMALRRMKNIHIDAKVTSSDDEAEILCVTITDLEDNISYSQDVEIGKTVERSRPADDGSFIKQRMNSRNKPVYTVHASEDELANKRNSLVSKAIRGLGLRMIPGDIKDDGLMLIMSTRKAVENGGTSSAKNSIETMVNSFSSILGIGEEEIEKYLGYPVSKATSSDVEALRRAYGTIGNGEATWESLLAFRQKKSSPPRPENKRSIPKKEAAPPKENKPLAQEKKQGDKKDQASDEKKQSAPPETLTCHGQQVVTSECLSAKCLGDEGCAVPKNLLPKEKVEGELF